MFKIAINIFELQGFLTGEKSGFDVWGWFEFGKKQEGTSRVSFLSDLAYYSFEASYYKKLNGELLNGELLKGTGSELVRLGSEFRETLVQFMEYVKKSIDERALHKIEYDSRVNERQTHTIEEKIDTSNALDALDASSVIIKSNGTESQKQDTSSRSRNDADIRPIYDEDLMDEVQITADDNVLLTGQTAILSKLNQI
ncbi:hypothetical protein Tco_1016956 [Tanacetum coccineum]|uniref:Uncharacterized protein n=1 Tax=Tanacetum coccineum TaxID=301880 RepID=A0ABQ5FQ78_9ASTR